MDLFPDFVTYALVPFHGWHAAEDTHWLQREGRERGSREGEGECPSVTFLASTNSLSRCLQGNGWCRKGRKRSRRDREGWRGGSAAGRTNIKLP